MHVYLRGGLQQRLRLASGCVLFAFVTVHLANHALGLFGLEAMHEMQEFRMAVTRSAAGTVVLYAALLIHVALALCKLSMRTTWRMPLWERLQIALGLAIPFFLFPHIVNTRVAHAFFHVEDSYLYELVRLWPEGALVQTVLLAIVWAHGCLGLHVWLRLSDAYRWLAPILLIVAIVVQVLALAGFAVAGRTTSDIMSDPEALAALKMSSNWPDTEENAMLARSRLAARIAFYAAAAGAAVLIVMRQFSNAYSRHVIRVSYAGGPTVDVVSGKTLLELSRSAGIPHAWVCGGRGRCSTCRVRIDSGLERLPLPSGSEAMALRSIQAPSNIRLACQLKPATSLTVTIVSHPATRGPPQEDYVETKQFVVAHVRAILANQLLEFQSASDVAVLRWITDSVPYAFPVSHLSASGFTLLGARVDFLSHCPTAAIIYQRQEHVVTLFATRAKAAWLAMRGHSNGYHVLAWTDGKLTYVAVSGLASRELDRLEMALAPSQPTLKVHASSAVV